MNANRLPLLVAAALAAFLGAAVPRAEAGLACAGGLGDTCAPIVLAQAGCGAAASRVAAEHGGQVVGTPQVVQQDGRTMCVVTILVSDPQGQQPPMRKQVTVPAD